jgi:hypothetical protein
MHSLVFDLETSSKHPVGQILNYAFVLYGEDFQELSRCNGSLKLSPLELPEAGAILANRVNVKELMEGDAPSERAGLKYIHNYLSAVAETASKERKPIAMIGFNSFRFDIPYLRTSLIRIGLNPYFGKWLLNRDLLPAVRWLSCTDSRFPRLASVDDPAKLSLRLETLAKHFGLLSGSQSHESLDDVLLTTKVITEIQARFGLDVREFQSYQPSREHERFGQVLGQLQPVYDLGAPYRAELKPMMFLCASSSGALWVDLLKFAECRTKEAVRWFSKATGSFFAVENSSDHGIKVDERMTDVCDSSFLSEVQQCCADITMDNYFTPSVCDIEQDIYRLDFDAREALNRAVWAADRSKLDRLQNKDARSLAIRAYLKEVDWNRAEAELPMQMLERYAAYRYGVGAVANNTSSRLLLSRFADDAEGTSTQAGIHTSLASMKQELDQRVQTSSNEDKVLLAELRWWYQHSPIGKLDAAMNNKKEL